MDAQNMEVGPSSERDIVDHVPWLEQANPFASRQYVIETELSLAECRTRLKQQVRRTVDGWLLTYTAPFGRKPPTFFGSVDDRSFSIRQHVRSSTFGAGRPDHVVAAGALSVSQRGTRVAITCAMSVYAQILLAGWLIAGVMGGVVAIVLLASNGPRASVVLAAGLLGFSLLVGGYTCFLRSRAPRNEYLVVTWIRDALDGTFVAINER